LLALLVVAAPARADEPTSRVGELTPTERAVAKRLFKEATDLYNAKQWDEAAQKLRQAIAIKDTPGLRYHLAHCEQHLGLLVEAMLNYDRAGELIAAGTPAADVAALLPDAQRALSRRVPTLVIVSPSGVTGVQVSIDGQVIAPAVLERPAPVNPGQHRVRAWAPGYLDFDTELTLSEGERRVVTLRLTPEAAPPAEAAPAQPVRARPSASSGLTTRTYVLVGEVAVTAAALAVGVTFAVAGSQADDRVARANDRVDRVASQSGVPAECSVATGDVLESCNDLSDAVDDRNRYRLLSTVGFVGAGVGAIATLATYLFWPERSSNLAVSARAGTRSFQLGVRASF
jgi:hypothetical protein